MQIKYAFLLLLFFIAAKGQSQESEQATEDVTKITFLNPGFSYEKSIGKKTTLQGHFFLKAITSFEFFDPEYSSRYYIDPALQLQYRYYYNYNKRQEKDKRTARNSMNYISPTLHSFFSKSAIFFNQPEEEKRRLVTTLGAVWGLQRNGEKRFSFDFNIGFGYRFGTTTTVYSSSYSSKTIEGQLTTLGELNLGFWLNRN